MRFLRKIVNYSFRTIHEGMEGSDREKVSFFFDWAARVLPMPKELRTFLSSQCCKDGTYLLSKAIAQTPYGQPLKFSEPMVVTVGTSNYCPLQCANCYSNSRPQSSLEKIFANEHLYEKLANMKTPYFIITGGEPLLDEDICSKLEILLKAGKNINISTNLLVKQLESIVHRYPKQVSLIFPVWGLPEKHDILRGKGSYVRLTKNLKLTESWPVERILFAAIRKNDSSALDCSNILSYSFHNLELKVARIWEVGRHEKNQSNNVDYLNTTIMDKVRQMRNRFIDVTIEIPELIPRKKYFMFSVLEKLFGIPVQSKCAAGDRLLHIDSNGRIYPCPSFEGSNIFDSSFQTPLKERWIKNRDSFGDLRIEGHCAAERCKL